MNLSPTPRQVILQEVFDEASVPTDEEIYDYAIRIGIDIDNEPHLLYLARDGLMQALPLGWKPCYDKDKKEIYYFNFKTKKAQWEHPLDEVYRKLVKKARVESGAYSEQIDDDSRTSIKEDLKSFEEASSLVTTNEMYPKLKKLEPLSPIGKGTLKKVPTPLNPVKKSNSKDVLKGAILKSPLHIDEEKLLHKGNNEEQQKKMVFDETEVRIRPNSSDIRNRRNIGLMELRNLSKQEIIAPNALEKFNFLTETKKTVESKISESPSVEVKGSDSGIVTKDEGYGTEFSSCSLGEKGSSFKKELTLTGGGSVFLKSNRMKSSPSSDLLLTSSFSKEELSDGLLSPDLRKSGSEIDSHPKGILREQNFQKSTEKGSAALEKKLPNDDVDDERKSVRFNLEKELKITFEVPRAKPEHDENNPSILRQNISPKRGGITRPAKEREEVRQIEIDFDDLDLDLSDEKPENKVEEKMAYKEPEMPGWPINGQKDPAPILEQPKKFKPSQTLVKEFRQIFENQSKAKANPIEIRKMDEKTVVGGDGNSEIKSSRSHSSRSVSSQSDKNSCLSIEEKSSENSKLSQINNLLDLSDKKESISQEMVSDRLKGDIFHSTLDSLVDFALKKKLCTPSEMNSTPKSNSIQYQEKEYLLDDILKGSGKDLLEGSDDEKVFISDDKELEFLEDLESQINLKAQRRKELEECLKREEKTAELEREYKIWLEDMEKSYERKRREEEERLKMKFEDWLKGKEIEMEGLYQKRYDEESQSKFKEMKNELSKKGDEDLQKLKRELESEQRERLKKLKDEMKAEEEKDLENVRKSFDESLNERKIQLMRKHKEEMEKIERNLEDLLSEQKSQRLKELELARENEAVIEVMRLEMKESYQKQKTNLMKEHELLLENLRQEHALALEQLRIEFKNEEEALKKVHMNRLEEIRMRVDATEARKTENIDAGRAEATETRVFEKVRCEKRLLEDKYKTLKEKYIKLKTEAKSTLERKKKKKETSVVMTGSETEKSSSYKTNPGMVEKAESDYESPSAKRKQEVDKKMKLKKQINNLGYLYQDVSTEDEENMMSPKNLPTRSNLSEEAGSKSLDLIKKQIKNEEKQMKLSLAYDKSKEESSGEERRSDGRETKKKRQLFSRFKAASTSKINMNNKSQGKETLSTSPVENLRRQLKKLEELEDQFPDNTHTDTYMRYPFTDNPQFGSSEIEFFKHRIHLERESVRRAKDSLKAQKKSFENRQRELKQKLVEGDPGTKSVIDQIYQEEKELTDMEVSVHRTRALLGEKIIRLRHLEQSLKRISQPLKKDSFSVKGKDLLGRLGVRSQQNKDEDRTLSDLSSYSGSSGFSSTDFNDTHNATGGGRKGPSLEQNRRHFQNNMQESSEIIQSLENLNSEIREIWEVLKKQYQSGHEITMLPPPPLIYGDLGWPTYTLSPPLPFRNTVITSTSNLQRPVAQQFKTQVASTSNLCHVSTLLDSSLVDRTRSLRDWLKAARNSSSPSDAINTSQVTL